MVQNNSGNIATVGLIKVVCFHHSEINILRVKKENKTIPFTSETKDTSNQFTTLSQV